MKSIKNIAIFLMTLILIIFIPFSVCGAEGDNAAGGGTGSASGSDVGGASDNRCGYRIYVVDEVGNLKSKVIDLVTIEPNVSGAYYYTRIGEGVMDTYYIMPTDMPKPFIWQTGTGFVGNGLTLREWMRSDGANGKQNIMNIIASYLGDDVAELFENTSKEYYCAVEPIAWHNIYTTHEASSNSGVSFYGTAYNWLNFYSENKLQVSGFTAILDNNVLQRCLVLAYDQDNLDLVCPTSTGYVTLNNLGKQGMGIQLYCNRDLIPACTTYDEDMGNTPAKAPDESSGNITIVKNYRTEIGDEQYIDDGCYIRTGTTNLIEIEDEPEYKVVKWRVTNKVMTPDSIDWKPAGTIFNLGYGVDNITVGGYGTVLYVLLEKTDIRVSDINGDNIFADYIVGESYITKVIDLGQTDKGVDVLNNKEITWHYQSLGCGGHEGEHDWSCYHQCTTECKKPCELKDTIECWDNHDWSCDHILVDERWVFKLRNSMVGAYSKTVAYNDFWVDYNSEDIKDRENLGAGLVDSEHTYKMVVHRGEDKLSIAEWKNLNAAIDSLSNFKTSSTTSNRKKIDYTNSITVNFQPDAVDTLTSSKGEACRKEDYAYTNDSVSADLEIGYEVYSGNTDGGSLNIDVNNNKKVVSGISTITSGRMVESGLKFSFRPYIMMQYESLDGNGNVNKDTTFVLGQYNRQLQLNDWAEVKWTKSNGANLKLDSRQWSTHATPTKERFTDGTINPFYKGTECVLPGGATLTLSIPSSSRQKIEVTTYQAILEGVGREQVEKTTNKIIEGYTAESALAEHNNYVDSVVLGLKGLYVTQWQNKDNEDPFDGVKVYSETDIRSLDNGSNTTSTEDKYYFRTDAEEGAINSAFLDVNVKKENVSVTKYVFSTNTSGQVLMNGSIILEKDQQIDKLTGTAKMINERTYVVTKLVDSIERNSGNDYGASWASGDGHWYNEAFDGITVIVHKTVIETGFVNPLQRECVLDPKLCANSTGVRFDSSLNKYLTGAGKGFMFTKYMVAQFKTSESSVYYNEHLAVGMFKNNTIYMEDMDMLYKSKVFYIPNVVVSDLY